MSLMNIGHLNFEMREMNTQNINLCLEFQGVKLHNVLQSEISRFNFS